MNLSNVRTLIQQGNFSAVEDAWLEAIERSDPPETMYEVLQELTAADHDETASTLAGMLLEDRVEKLPPEQALHIARVVLPGAPATDELRVVATDLYRKACADVEHIEQFLDASGLEGKCTLRRAMAAMDICFGGKPGAYLVNPYQEDDVLRIERFDPTSATFEVAGPGAMPDRMDPPDLADDYQLTTDIDWRVLTTFRAGEVEALVADNPAAVLIGVCMARGGQIDANKLKALLVPRYLQTAAWSGWWNRARTAIKRSDQLVLEGRNPAIIAYHPRGLTLEAELADRVKDARTPLDLHAVLTDYRRELAHRKADVDPAFAGAILNTLAQQAHEYRQRRPDDALTAALAIDDAVAGGLPAPPADYPSPREAVSALDRPAESIAGLGDAALTTIALDALEQCDTAPEQLEKLLALMPTDALDDLAARCRRASADQAVERAATDALADGVKRLPVLMWLWRGPAQPVAAAPGPLELLSRVLAAGQQIGRDVMGDREFRRDSFHLIRTGLIASHCATFHKAAAEMSEGSAATIKRRVERCDALSESTRPKLLAIIRERFYKLFLESKVDPWRDESVLWTTEASLTAQEAELKHLVEEVLPDNSKRIGEAAEKGDLSENADWQYAVEEQRRLQARVSKLKGNLGRARVLHPGDVPLDSVGVGSRVTLKRTGDGGPIEITILGPWESDVAAGTCSYLTPLALALLGKAIGDKAVLKLDGPETEFEIVALTCGLEG